MYLSKIYIKNFRGIKELLVEFDKKLNVIIGANGQLKTSLMDAIRLFYVWGEPNRDIEITKEDFYVEFTQNPDGTKVATTSTRIEIYATYLKDYQHNKKVHFISTCTEKTMALWLPGFI